MWGGFVDRNAHSRRAALRIHAGQGVGETFADGAAVVSGLNTHVKGAFDD